ncbi:MAG: hypothetical protein ABS882_12230, partial [Lysinibacillus sp.]
DSYTLALPESVSGYTDVSTTGNYDFEVKEQDVLVARPLDAEAVVRGDISNNVISFYQNEKLLGHFKIHKENSVFVLKPFSFYIEN